MLLNISFIQNYAEQKSSSIPKTHLYGTCRMQIVDVQIIHSNCPEHCFLPLPIQSELDVLFISFCLQKFLFFAHNRRTKKNNMFSIFVPFLFKTNCKLTAWLSQHPPIFAYTQHTISKQKRFENQVASKQVCQIISSRIKICNILNKYPTKMPHGVGSVCNTLIKMNNRPVFFTIHLYALMLILLQKKAL